MQWRDWKATHPLASRFLEHFPGVLVVGASLAFAWLMIQSAEVRRLTQLELILYESIVLGLGIIGSFVLGRASAKSAAGDVVRPHARSAFRRVVSLYEALGRIESSVADRRTVLIGIADEGGQISITHVESALDLIATQALEQIGTANDAMEDWRDLVPDEVANIEGKVEGEEQSG
jgi:hypothetical protein